MAQSTDARENAGDDVLVFEEHAETLDWTAALVQLDKLALDPETVDNTLGVLLKYQDDIARIRGSEAANILDELKAASAPGTQ